MYVAWYEDDEEPCVIFIDEETRGKARASATWELNLDFTAPIRLRKAVPCDDCGEWSVKGQCWDCYEKEQAELERQDMERRGLLQSTVL